MVIDEPLRMPLAITAVSGLSPVGETMEETCASIRSKVAGFDDHPTMTSRSQDPSGGENVPLRVAFAAGIDPDVGGIERLHVLARSALQDLFDRARMTRKDLATTGLLVALPEPDTSFPMSVLDGFAETLVARAGLSGLARIEAFPAGHAAAFAALGAAARWLAEGVVKRAIVLAVDSYLPRARLERLNREARLKTRRGVDGFVPGEAAFGLLVETARRAASRDGRVLATLEAVGLAVEPQPFASLRGSTGRGLTGAVRDVLPEGPPGLILGDLNGESYRSFEWGLARTRLAKRIGPGREFVHPADCVGDVGAASGGLLVAAAIQGFRRGYAPRGDAVAFTASNGGARAAVRLRGPRGEAWPQASWPPESRRPAPAARTQPR